MTARSRTAELLAEAQALDTALGRAGDRVPPQVRARVQALLAGVADRLALGVDQTVVALVGGTGSGKSSLFNALTGLDFADVGVRRPTTAEVTACVWAHDATALLDWLGVGPDRRIERESALDGESQADLRGLVLLDLPDHDSVEAAHHAVVDRLVPQVDLLCWVLDPQKYADDAVHTGYLSTLAGHEAAMLVVLNQIDTVPEHARADLLADVARLLHGDGLAQVRTLAVSATAGDGLADLRAVLADAVGGHGVAEQRAVAELADAAAALAEVVGPGEPEPPVGRAVDALLEAAGVPDQATALRVGAPPAAEPSAAAPTLGPVQADRAALVREAWLAEVTAGLPAPWADAVAAAVADDAALVAAVDAALAGVGVPTDLRPDPPAWLAWLGGRRRRATRAAAADRMLASGRAALSAAVEQTLAAPTRAVLEDHGAVRVVAARLVAARAAASVRGESSTGQGPAASSTD